MYAGVVPEEKASLIAVPAMAPEKHLVHTAREAVKRNAGIAKKGI